MAPRPHRLEATLQRRVFLDMLAVLIQRRCPNQMQLAARQHRLEHIGCIHRALCRARTHNCVQLIDEDNDVVGLLDLFEHCFESFFELTTVLGASYHCAQVDLEQTVYLSTLPAHRRV